MSDTQTIPQTHNQTTEQSWRTWCVRQRLEPVSRRKPTGARLQSDIQARLRTFEDRPEARQLRRARLQELERALCGVITDIQARISAGQGCARDDRRKWAQVHRWANQRRGYAQAMDLCRKAQKALVVAHKQVAWSGLFETAFHRCADIGEAALAMADEAEAKALQEYSRSPLAQQLGHGVVRRGSRRSRRQARRQRAGR